MSREEQLLQYTHRMAALVQQELSSLLLLPPRADGHMARHSAGSRDWLETVVSNLIAYHFLGKGCKLFCHKGDYLTENG